MDDVVGDRLASGTQRQPARPIRAAIVIVAVCGALVVGAALCWPRTTVVKVLSQPQGVAYHDGSTHVAVLKHVRAPMAAVQLTEDTSSVVNHYEVVLGRDPSGRYGHYVRMDATGIDPSQLTVEWTTEGVWLDYQAGHRLFVPAKYFIGGR